MDEHIGRLQNLHGELRGGVGLRRLVVQARVVDVLAHDVEGGRRDRLHQLQPHQRLRDKEQTTTRDTSHQPRAAVQSRVVTSCVHGTKTGAGVVCKLDFADTICTPHKPFS